MRFFKLLAVVVCILISVYLVLPSPVFPPPPEGALQSLEPGDQESVYRRAYFTNLSRSEVIDHYSEEFSAGYPHLLLNYPPEEAFALIRDQTRSSWLQELVHIGRESLYINGFYPTKPTEQINIDGIHYINKITVRYIPSHPATRLTGLLLAGICAYLLVKEYVRA